MSSKGATSKTYTRYPASDALKRGCPTTIESSVIKIKIAQEYVNLREKYKRLKIDNQKQNVKLEQMEQLKKDNDSKLMQLTKKNDIINKLHTTIAQLNNDIKLLKETSVDRGDAQRLEGFIKKKDQEIKDLKKQIDSTKINAVASLENKIHQLNSENEKLKAKLADVEEQSKKDNPQSRFDMIKVLSDDIQKVIKENEDLKKERDDYKGLSEEWREQSNEICNLMGKDTDGWSNIAGDTLSDVKDLLYERDTLKQEHGELIQKLDKFQKVITDLYDDF